MSVAPPLLVRQASVAIALARQDSPALTTVQGRAMHVLVRSTEATWTLLALDEQLARAAPDRTVPLVTATALVACGDRLIAAGTGPQGWLLIDGERLVPAPSRPHPVCVAGRPQVLTWEHERLIVAELGSSLRVLHALTLEGPTPRWSAAGSGDHLVLARAGRPGPVEILRLAAGEVSTVLIPASEGATAPHLATSPGRIVVSWVAPGRLQRVMVQPFDEDLRPLQPARQVAALPEPHAVAATFVAAGPGDALVVSYVDRRPLDAHPGRAAGLPRAHALSTWGVLLRAGHAGPPQLLVDGAEAIARWLGDELVTLTSPPLTATAWRPSSAP